MIYREAAVMAILTFTLLPVTRALADAVPPAPSNCPPGTRGMTNHVFQGCAPANCNTDATCASGETCTAYPMCARRWTSDSSRGASYSAVADGPCKEGKCKEGFTCETKPVCVPKDWTPTSAPTPPTPSAKSLPTTTKPNSCGCRTPGGDDAPWGAAALGVALGAFAGRRRASAGTRS